MQRRLDVCGSVQEYMNNFPNLLMGECHKVIRALDSMSLYTKSIVFSTFIRLSPLLI